MNQHQQRLWKAMIAAVDEYQAGQVDLTQLVGRLEGALDAGEFKDRALVKAWYDHWGPLEEMSALGSDAAPRQSPSAYVVRMRAFLARHLPEESA